MAVTRKVDDKDTKVVDATSEEVEGAMAPAPMTFAEKYIALGRYIREKAPEVLKFDSNVSNIDYDYVDTQQYKAFVGMCCNVAGLGFQWETSNAEITFMADAKGKQVTMVKVSGVATIVGDINSGEQVSSSVVGVGFNYNPAHCLSAAETNAMRNYLTNNFLIPTSDRDSDDMKSKIEVGKYLTNEQKSEKRTELLEKTKSGSLYATITYGNVLQKRIVETLTKDIPEDFKAQLTKFMAEKFADDKPIPVEGDESLWIVKKKAASAIMSDLDKYE